MATRAVRLLPYLSMKDLRLDDLLGRLVGRSDLPSQAEGNILAGQGNFIRRAREGKPQGEGKEL